MHSTTESTWLPYLDLACATGAGAVWYAFPQAGPWPLVLALSPWLVRAGQTGCLTRRTPFDLPILFFLLTAGVGVWVAYDRQAAWSKFWLIVGGGLLFYALVNAEPIGEVRVWLLAFFGAGVAFYFLSTHDWGANPAKFEAVTRFGRTLQTFLPTLPGHRLHFNVAGGIMAMMIPYAGWVTGRAWSRLRRGARSSAWVSWLRLVSALGALALTLLGLVMTTSRGAWIALGTAGLLAGLWAASGWLSGQQIERRTWIFPGLVGLMLLLALGVGIGWRGGIATVLDALPGGNTVLSRADLLRNTWTLVRDYPVTGSGLGGFAMLYSTYALLIHVKFSTHAHNLVLDIAVEQGLPAVLALVWAWIAFAIALGRRLTGSGSRYSGALGAAALSLFIGLVHGLADDILYGSRAVLLLFVPLAFAVPSIGSPRLVPRGAAVSAPLGLVLLFGAALVWRAPLLSHIYSNLGAVHQSQTELSRYTWPQWPMQDALRREVDLSRPVAEFEHALSFYPRNATANRRLGMIELALGEYDDALTHLAAAYAVEPESETTRQLYGEALIVNGRVDEGRALWAGVRNTHRQLQSRVYWYRLIGDTTRAAWVQQALEGR